MLEENPNYFTCAICPNISKMTVSKIFFYQITGGKKYALTKQEYKILTNPNDIQMVIFHQYLLYIIYRRVIPYSIYHFQYINMMLKQIENRQKRLQKLDKK